MLWLLSSDDSSCKLRWAKDVPASIQPLVNGGIAYLRTYLLSGQFSLGNAFFSGSEKVLSALCRVHSNTVDRFMVVTNPPDVQGDSTFPFAYPGTYSFYRYQPYRCLGNGTLCVVCVCVCCVCVVCVACVVCVVCGVGCVC
jgi:hypothetical protein